MTLEGRIVAQIISTFNPVIILTSTNKDYKGNSQIHIFMCPNHNEKLAYQNENLNTVQLTFDVNAHYSEMSIRYFKKKIATNCLKEINIYNNV